MESVTSPLGRGSVPSRLEDLRLYLLERARGIDTLSPAPLAITEESVGGFTLVTFSWEYGTISRPGAPRPDGFVFWTELASSLSVGFPRLTGVNLPLTARSHQVLLPPGMVLRGAVQTFRTVHRTVEYGEFVQPDDWLASTLAEAPLDAGDFLLLAGRNGTANNPIISLTENGVIYGSALANKGLVLEASSIAEVTARRAIAMHDAVSAINETVYGVSLFHASGTREIDLSGTILGNVLNIAPVAMLDRVLTVVAGGAFAKSLWITGVDLRPQLLIDAPLGAVGTTQGSLNGIYYAPQLEVVGTEQEQTFAGALNAVAFLPVIERASRGAETANTLILSAVRGLYLNPDITGAAITLLVGLDCTSANISDSTIASATAVNVASGWGDQAAFGAKRSLWSQDADVIFGHYGPVAIGQNYNGAGGAGSYEYNALLKVERIIGEGGDENTDRDVAIFKGDKSIVRIDKDGRLYAVGVFTDASGSLAEQVADNNTFQTNAASYATITSQPTIDTSYVLDERIGLYVKDISGAGSQTDFIGIKIADQTVSGTKKSLETTDAAMSMDHAGPAAFGGDVTVPDEAYGSGWNGSLEVPTKNALYDKIETLGGGGITWNTEAGTTLAAAVANGYVLTAGSLTTATLPATCAVGDSVRLIGVGTKVKVTANTGQTIRLPWAETTAAGSLTAQEDDNDIELTCVVANTTWNARASGNFGVS